MNNRTSAWININFRDSQGSLTLSVNESATIDAVDWRDVSETEVTDDDYIVNDDNNLDDDIEEMDLEC